MSSIDKFADDILPAESDITTLLIGKSSLIILDAAPVMLMLLPANSAYIIYIYIDNSQKI